MLSKIISIPLVILVGILAYLTIEVDESFSYYIILCVILLAVIHTMAPQIDWAWYKKNPPKLDETMRQLLIQHAPFYNDLSLSDKQKFRDRMSLYVIATDFTPQGWESVPEDIKGVIAANVVRMTFQQEDFLLSKFEKVILYTTPFPSPQFPESIHASELFEEDGVLLFSAQQVMWTFLQPQNYYNLILHEYIKAYQISYPDKNYPQLTETDWPALENISTLTRDAIEGIINLKLDPSVVSGVLYFTHGKKYKEFAPDSYKKWEEIFN